MTNSIEDELPSFDALTTWGLGSLFLISSLFLYGDLTFSVFGYDVAEWLGTILLGEADGLHMTYAHAISLISIAGVYVGTATDIADFTDHQGLLGMGTAGMVVLLMISEGLRETVTATNNRAMALVGLMFIGFVAIVESKQMADRGWI